MAPLAARQHVDRLVRVVVGIALALKSGLRMDALWWKPHVAANRRRRKNPQSPNERIDMGRNFRVVALRFLGALELQLVRAAHAQGGSCRECGLQGADAKR